MLNRFLRIFQQWKLRGCSCQCCGMGVERNCCSISCGGEDDSTGLGTQTSDITPRTRCVPPGALMSAAAAKIKVLKRGAARFPVFVFSPGKANLTIDRVRNAIQENGASGREMYAKRALIYVCRADPSKFFLFCSCVCFCSFSWIVK